MGAETFISIVKAVMSTEQTLVRIMCKGRTPGRICGGLRASFGSAELGTTETRRQSTVFAVPGAHKPGSDTEKNSSLW
jgi:hypothetical protein